MGMSLEKKFQSRFIQLEVDLRDFKRLIKIVWHQKLP